MKEDYVTGKLSRSIRGRYIGFDEGSKSHVVLMPNNSIRKTRSAVFDEEFQDKDAKQLHNDELNNPIRLADWLYANDSNMDVVVTNDDSSLISDDAPADLPHLEPFTPPRPVNGTDAEEENMDMDESHGQDVTEIVQENVKRMEEKDEPPQTHKEAQPLGTLINNEGNRRSTRLAGKAHP